MAQQPGSSSEPGPLWLPVPSSDSPAAQVVRHFASRPPKSDINPLNFQEQFDAPFYPTIANHSASTIGTSSLVDDFCLVSVSGSYHTSSLSIATEPRIARIPPHEMTLSSRSASADTLEALGQDETMLPLRRVWATTIRHSPLAVECSGLRAEARKRRKTGVFPSVHRQLSPFIDKLKRLFRAPKRVEEDNMNHPTHSLPAHAA